VPRARVGEVAVVVGHEAGRVEAELGGAGVKLVVNAAYREGISSSIGAGVRAIRRDAPGVLVLLADQPFVSSKLLGRMLDAFSADQGRSTVAASHAGVVSPPVIFPRKYFRELERLSGDEGAKAVIERHRGSLLLVKIRSATTLADVDTREDLIRARRLEERRKAGKKVSVHHTAGLQPGAPS